jgi:hypothetical protein
MMGRCALQPDPLAAWQTPREPARTAPRRRLQATSNPLLPVHEERAA